MMLGAEMSPEIQAGDEGSLGEVFQYGECFDGFYITVTE